MAARTRQGAIASNRAVGDYLSAIVSGASPPTPRLRFGVIVDRDAVPGWQSAVVRALLDGGDADFALLLRARDTSDAGATSSRFSLWRLYNNGVVARRSRGVARAGSWTELAAGVPELSVTVERRGRWSQHVTGQDLVAIRDAGLDFVLRFGLGIIRGDVLDAARYGIWSFHHDDERVIRGGPPSFWELYDGLPTSGVLLQRLTDRLDGGIPLARATFRSVSALVSAQSRSHAVGRGGTSRAGRAFDPSGSRRSERDPGQRHRRAGAAQPDQCGDDQVLRDPDAPRDTCAGERCAEGRRVDGRARRTTRRSVRGDVALRSVEWLPEVKHSGYLADPFPARRDGRTAILVEEYDEESNRGVISALERVGDTWELRSGVIDPGVHASYPFLVEDDGELYCVPETWQAGRVELWRCLEFPVRWERAGVLVDGEAVVDPTVCEHEGRWWLFGTRKDDEPDAKLHVWAAPALVGPWVAHPLNPVKIDVGSSRPGGTPVVVDGVLYRPAQDCSTAYGSAVVINRVVSLDERGLREEPAGRLVVPSGRYGSGTHTLAGAGDLWVVDGRRYGTNRHRRAREIRSRLRRILPARASRAN